MEQFGYKYSGKTLKEIVEIMFAFYAKVFWLYKIVLAVKMLKSRMSLTSLFIFVIKVLSIFLLLGSLRFIIVIFISE